MNKDITRNNHYVPQLYLEAWSENNKIWRYELIVPNKHYPYWQIGSVERTGMQRDIYTRRMQGVDMDDLEKWFGTFETKAAEPLRKARDGSHLNADDWHALIDFVAIQCLRTPTSVTRFLGVVQDGIRDGLEQLSQDLSGPNAREKILGSPPISDESSMIPMSVEIDREKCELRTTAIAGKSTALFAMKSLMTGKACEALHTNNWGIITCDSSLSWPTSDNPVILLNAYRDGNYDFGGGWGRKNTEIILPISPRKAIYTKVKSKRSPRFQCGSGTSEFIRKIIVENAYRYVYSNFEDNAVLQIRKRTVDSDLYQEANCQLDKLHQYYLENEVPMIDSFLNKKQT